MEGIALLHVMIQGPRLMEVLPSLTCGFSDFPGCEHSAGREEKREWTNPSVKFYEPEQIAAYITSNCFPLARIQSSSGHTNCKEVWEM